MNESANTNTLSSQLQPPAAKNPELLARMVIKEGKPFKSSALACGYSASTASHGAEYLMRSSSAFAMAVKRVSADMSISLDRLKPLAIRRLHDEIVNPKSSLGIKAIELAGRFKETDWFVRNVDVQIGVFAQIGESSPAEESLEAYKEE